MRNITTEEAKNTRIYTVNRFSNYNIIEEDNLYDFVMESIDETTSPRGVEPRLHVRENEEEGTWEVWTWGVGGNNPRQFTNELFAAASAAEDYIFQLTYLYDFLEDDQRLTWYTESNLEVVEFYAESHDIDVNVAESIIKHSECLNEIVHIRKNKAIETARINKERIHNLAKEYAKMIARVEGEKYKETCRRLSERIGSRIEKMVFHQAVKIVRNS